MEKEGDGFLNFNLQVARELLDETELIYANSWELSLYPGPDGELVAFLIASVRLYDDMHLGDIKNICKLAEVDMDRVEFIVMELILLHEEEVSDNFVDDLLLLSYILPTAQEVEVRED